VQFDTVTQDEEQLSGEKEHPDGEDCGVQMQKQGRMLAQKTPGIETEAEEHSYPKNAEPDS
jgi:hypothetical protein